MTAKLRWTGSKTAKGARQVGKSTFAQMLAAQRDSRTATSTATVQRDLLDLHGPSQPERLRAALRLIAANQANELVNARTVDQAGIPGSTITGYVDALQTKFLISIVPPWTANSPLPDNGAIVPIPAGTPNPVVADETSVAG